MSYGRATCAFCDRNIGTQGGRLRPHKFSNNDADIYQCPGSDLTPARANEIFEEVLRRHSSEQQTTTKRRES